MTLTAETISAGLEKSTHISNSFILSGKLPVMEMFYTVQGEGFHAGTSAFFIRLSGCDVGCVWCDVKASWDVDDSQYVLIADIVREALRHPSRKVVITGGEPCMYNLEALINLLHQSAFKVHMETSGAYELSGRPDWICVSPKKFKSPLKQLLEAADELKVVVFNTSDFIWAETNASDVTQKCQLFLQPEFERSTKLMPAIVEYVKQHPNWRISLQTHKFIGIP